MSDQERSRGNDGKSHKHKKHKHRKHHHKKKNEHKHDDEPPEKLRRGSQDDSQFQDKAHYGGEKRGSDDKKSTRQELRHENWDSVSESKSRYGREKDECFKDDDKFRHDSKIGIKEEVDMKGNGPSTSKDYYTDSKSKKFFKDERYQEYKYDRSRLKEERHDKEYSDSDHEHSARSSQKHSSKHTDRSSDRSRHKDRSKYSDSEHEDLARSSRKHKSSDRSRHQDELKDDDEYARSSGGSKSHHDHAEKDRYYRNKHQRDISPSDNRYNGRKHVDSDQEKELPDYEFDWEKHRYELNKIFFSDDDVIRRNSDAYHDFWAFLEKYKAFQRKKATSKLEAVKKTPSESVGGSLGLPLRYDKRYRINVAFPPRDVGTYLKETRGRDPNALTKERVEQFKQILLHYVDFQQKQQLSKLGKIRRDQENLPIFQYKEKIIEGVKSYPIVVIAGDTGCGKSTQVPQYLLEAGYACIACTQPRRIACISLSKRVSYETLNEYGSEIAFQVRFEKSKTRATRILFLTEGLLLRQMSSEPLLPMYSVILIDEVHERHIHTDFLLGVLKALISQRSDLKLVLMSATINIELFSNYFENAPVIQVPGRLYPIQLTYSPIPKEEQSSKSERMDPSPYIRILQTIDKKYPLSERGDVLIFLSGMAEIMAVVEAAKMYAQQTKQWIVLPLHSMLSIAEQDKIFDISPEGVRKVIVSTNIAETSVTIDGVRFVVDSGKVKEMSFDPKYKMRRLQEFWISQASAEQRKGRAGRTGPGVCYRLYEEKNYTDLQKYSTPEIQRVPLDSLILQMTSMGLPDARKFPFIEPPAASSIENSIAMLREQGALNEKECLTPMGEMLAQLPVDVVIGKMLIMGSIFHMVDPVMTTAACLSVQSPFTSTLQKDYDATNTRKPLESDHGDPFTLLNCFDGWIEVKATNQASRKWCRRRGLEEQRFYEVVKLKKQFKELLTDQGLMDNLPEDYRNLTKEQRQQMHAGKKQLRTMKRTHDQQRVKRKVLKMDQDDFVLETGDDVEDGPDLDSDIKDLEFRLTHDMEQLQERSNSSRQFTLRDTSLLKVILCSGLYPQVAIADEFNSFKKASEQVFHTKSKPFVLLHPTSILANHTESLQLEEKDILDTGITTDQKKVYSSKHQLLTYVSLLETIKPYLMGSMRVPALQTLTLYAMAIDTNTDCSRFLCDGWLEILFHKAEDGVCVLSSVVQLRTTWTKLIEMRLKVKKQSGISDPLDGIKVRKLERLLAKKLGEFLNSDIVYAIRRVLSAETNHMYKGPETGDSASVNEVLGDLGRDAQPHPTKGGMQINEYITFNCLVDDSSAYGEYTTYLQQHWTCPNCAQHMVVSVVQRLQHEEECIAMETPEATQEAEKQRLTETVGHLRKEFHCPNCNQDFVFTATEILKHKKQCKAK